MIVRRELDAAATGPLQGLRVIDMTSVVNGPYATHILADQGADVIKIEDAQGHRGGGDTMRWTGPSPEAAPPGMGPIFCTINRNKRSVVLDLRDKSARTTLHDIIADADVFVSSVRYAGLARMGLAYEDVASIRPDIVYAHAAGYGADGAYGGDPAYDDLIQAASGFCDIFSLVNGDPTPKLVPTLIADKVAGLFLAQAVTAALLHRARTGEGQFVEVPMLECVTSFLLVEHLYGQAFSPPVDQWGYPRVANPARRPYPTKDGFIALLPYTQAQWRDFFALVGWSDTVAQDPRFATESDRFANIQALYALLETVTPDRTTAEWLAILRPLSIPAVRCNRLDDLSADPHLQSVGMFERYEHPDMGGCVQLRPPVRFSRTPSNIRRLPPALGEHNAELGVG